MSQDLKLGLVGLDTSHVVAFTKLLNDSNSEHHIAGAPVVAAWAGGSPDWPTSIDRMPKFRDEVSSHAVDIVDTPEAVAERSDLVLITAVDGRAHRDLLGRVLPAGKPVFIDKPFAASSDDAAAMVEMARERGVPLMSCSSLRYAEPFMAAMEAVGGQSQVKGADVFGPLRFESALPGLFWYGCHGIEMLIAAMGPGVARVRSCVEEEAEVYVATWSDGRVATYRGNRVHHGGFGGVIHADAGCATFDVSRASRPMYATMLEAILRSLPSGRSDVPAEEMVACTRLIEACNRSRESGQEEAVGQ